MGFPERLTIFRKKRQLTQEALADQVGVRKLQISRYERGTTQPTLEVIRQIAITLGVTADELLFGRDERGPDDDLRLQFEAVTRMSPDEKRVVKEVIEAMILKHDARRRLANDETEPNPETGD